MDMNWKKEVLDIVDGIKLNGKNKKFRKIIEEPWGFGYSMPGELGRADQDEYTETNWQRELLFEKETNCWYDGELPIGQVVECDKVTKECRVDLVGMIESHPVICELKYTKEAGQPFDALLQLLAYYCMIVNNAEKLDQCDIHHKNKDVKVFNWGDFKNNTPILILRANEPYWSNWSKTTNKNKAAKKIIEDCKEYGLEIQLWNGERPIE